MRICVGLKGSFEINNVRKKLDTTEEYQAHFDECANNLKQMIVQPFLDRGDSVDILLSTYDTPVFERMKNAFHPLSTNAFSYDDINNGTDWQRQLIHYLALIHQIKTLELTGSTYDIFIITRFDLIFAKSILSMNIDWEKFNIAMCHSSGNCDDNFWIFQKEIFDRFVLSIEDLYNRRDITHAINHALVKVNTPIHYMYEVTEEDYANDTCYKVFEFHRRLICKERGIEQFMSV